MKYWVRTPLLIQRVFHKFIWRIPNNQKQIYLTFDDGPSGELTSQIIKLLKEEDILCTFFCVGHNVKTQPAVFQEIIQNGHSIGNHSMTHINGWKVNKIDYIKDIKEAEAFIASDLFRPPYGRINLRSRKTLLKKYKIIMWDVAGGDFDPELNSNQIAKNVINNVKSGSIIVMHDNEKFKEKTLGALPLIIKEFKNKGYQFSSIPYACQS